MGMKSAWSHVENDFILFVPWDVTFIPDDIFEQLHQVLKQHPSSDVVAVKMNEQSLYPFCLMYREALPIVERNLALNQCSLRSCFQDLAYREFCFEQK